MDVTIRAEELRDTEAIRAITIAAFRGKPYAGGNEQDGEPADYFMMKCFGKDAPAARFRFHSAFYPA